VGWAHASLPYSIFKAAWPFFYGIHPVGKAPRNPIYSKLAARVVQGH